MAKVKKYSDDNVSMRSVWNDSGDKRYGFVSKDRVPDERVSSRYQTRYGVGLDNSRSPYSGYYEKDINTPLGTLDYGYDGDTSFAGFTPNITRTSDYYTNGEGNPWHMDYTTLGANSDRSLNIGTWGNPANPVYGGVAFLGGDQNYIPDFDKTFNTPLGNLQLARNTEEPNSVLADLYPNNQTAYYIQALANLLNRR